jgi:TRAP-type transport system periplasmic protein
MRNAASSPWIALGFFLAPVVAAAEPIELKFSFFTSDRSQIYQNSVKPFVDAVNADGDRLVHIEVYFSGGISAEISELPRLVSEGRADMALIVPGRTPERFTDTAVMQMPGLFRSAHEADAVYTQLVGKGMLAGYEDFQILGAFISGAENIHSSKPIESLKELRGLRIRVNNLTEADVLQRLGAIPVLLSINEATEAVADGKIDGATLPPSMLSEFGIGRVATHHYMIALGGAPQVLVMNRTKFDSLPPRAQAVIRKYSGNWIYERSSKRFDALDREIVEKLQADARRSVVFPSPQDLKTLDAVYAEVIQQWGALSLHNSDLLARVRGLLATLRTTE